MSRFFLASKSPRRRQILCELGFSDFTVLSDNTVLTAFAGDEERRKGEAPALYVSRTAREKALRAFERIRTEKLPLLPVLAADTAVILDDMVLGKPADRVEEHYFLSLLSGKTHTVRTVVLVGTNPEDLREAESVSFVRFKELTKSEIDWYCRQDEPYDKAGGYAVQGLAAAFIDHIEGSYSGIMGLPAFETAALLNAFGITQFP